MTVTMTNPQDYSLTPQSYSNSRYNKELLNDGSFGDCTIRCKGRSWRAHRNILSPRCHFFRVCFNGNFRESTSGTNEVRMDDDHTDAVEGLMYYLYTLDYPKHDTSMSSDPYQDWKRDILLYSIADKYCLPEFMRLARQSLLDAATNTDVCNKDTFVKNLDKFESLIDDLYTPDETPSERMKDLRVEVMAALAEVVARNIRDFRLSRLVAEYPDFALDVLEAIGKVQQEREVALPGVQTGYVKRQQMVHIPLNEDSDSEYE